MSGQNYGARLGARVRESFRVTASMSVAVMLVFTVLCHVAPAAMVRLFSRDEAVVAFGSEYLQIVSWNFIASGLVLVTSSVFQGMGNTLPALASSALRLLLFALPAYTLSHRLGFEMRHAWYLSVASVAVRVCLNLWLLRLEFDRNLAFAVSASPPAIHRPDRGTLKRSTIWAKSSTIRSSLPTVPSQRRGPKPLSEWVFGVRTAARRLGLALAVYPPRMHPASGAPSPSRDSPQGAIQEEDMQISSSRLLTFVALGGALTLVACGGSSEISPVAPAPPVASQSDDGGPVASDGYGPGTGTCTNDCDGTGQGPGPGRGTGNGYGPGPGPSDGFCGNACVGPVGPDPGDIVAILERALQEENGAEMLYRHVLAIFGADTAPFALIAEAEARHVAALKLLFTRRNLALPAWTPVSFPAFGTIPAACADGVRAELADAAFYTPYLERTDLPQDVRNVFTNLQAASLDNHLPAFERCQ